MITVPAPLPDDPEVLKQLLSDVLLERQSNLGKITQLQEQVALLRDRLFGRKSEQTGDPESPQLPLLNEAEVLAGQPDDDAQDDVGMVELRPAAVSKPRGKRQPLPAELPRVEVIHELPRRRCSPRAKPGALTWRRD